MDRSKLFETLKERGYVYQTTNEEAVRKLCNGQPMTVYVGIDPTASSLHIGHFFSLMMAKYFQDAGHKVLVLVGGATAMIGDPSGRTDMRSMITPESVENNLLEIKGIINKFLNISGNNPATIVNNADWFKGYDYITFMRDIGAHFNVNKMLSADAYANRLKEGGLTFLEMGYMLMQAYDFIHLNNKYNCVLQIGGSDQWGNMIAGCELGRKLNAHEGTNYNLEVLTCPLLTNAEGVKMGKTAKGALWVAKDKTSVFDFYQYFYNMPDIETEKLLKLFTRIPLDEINGLVNSDILAAKRLMAFEITKLVHGEQEAKTAEESAKALFSGSDNLDNAPTYKIENFVSGELTVSAVALQAGIVVSTSEARRAIEQGGLSLNGEKVADANYKLVQSDFEKGYALLKKGKKVFIKLTI